MRRGGDVDEKALLCNASLFLSHWDKGSLPLSNEASHTKDVGVNYSFLEESPTPLSVASTPSLQMRYSQFGARLQRGRSVAQARAGCHRSPQVFNGKIQFATRQGCDSQRTVDGAKADHRQGCHDR